MIYSKLKKYAPERLACAYVGILFAFLSALFLIVSYFELSRFLSEIFSGNRLTSVLPLALRIVLFLVVSTFVYFMAAWTTHVLAFRLETNLKKEGLRRVMQASFSFFDRNESGRIRKIIDDNTLLTHMSVAHLIPDLSTAVFVPILGTLLAFFIDWKIGIFFLSSLLAGLVFIQKMMGERRFMEEYMKASEEMNASAVEYVRGIQVLKIFKTKVTSLKAFYESVRAYSDLALRYSMSCRRGYVAFQVFFNAVFLLYLFLYYLPHTEARHFLSLFMFYVLFSGILFVSLMKVMYVGMYVFQASSAIEKIETLFCEMEERKIVPGSLSQMKHHDIEFRKVSFGYTDELIVQDLSFRLEAGRTYALVGSSGSGKTTIARLISGFYRLNSGQILIGGHDLTAYSAEALSQNIAQVFQDARLFKRSIYENVRIGRSDASREEVMEALHLAQCDEILDKFQEREATLIGAKGTHLSGGEVQRIAIARAILKNAKIVILDEASAAADPENEYELQKALANLMKNKTVIMIAHRLGSIRNVDEALVIEGGKIVERGSHAELMAQPSHYRRLQEEFARANSWRVKE